MSRRQRAGMEITKVRLDPESVAALDQLAAERERTRSYLIRKAVEEYLARAAATEEAQTA